MKYTLLILCALTSFAYGSEVVIIGDSLTCGPFGDHVFEGLESKYDKVSLFCTVSSAPSNWILGKNPAKQVCMKRTERDTVNVKCTPHGKIIKFENILKDHPGSDVIIALGTNSLMDNHVDSFYSEMVKLAPKCKWIGPPHIHPAQAQGFPVARLKTLEKNLTPFYASLASVTQGRCTLIDSRPFTSAETVGYQTVDGVHRTEEAGKFWADGISSQL